MTLEKANPTETPNRSGAVPACRICHNVVGNNIIVAREMMFGWRDEFEYVECAGCGCVQIRETPADIERFYPGDYVAFGRHLPVARTFRDRLLAFRTAHQLGGRTRLGALMHRLRGNVPDFVDWSRRAGFDQSHRVLDVGCGTGALLIRMYRAGYTQLAGVDPYIDSDLEYGIGLRILRRELAELEGAYDLIMMHHSFEHMADPAATLVEASRLMRPGGRILIRIPIADSFAWHEYREDWVQLDPPRHLFLHTRRSLELLADEAGLEIVDVVYDSWAIQFWGSEQYRMGIPLKDPRSVQEEPAEPVFSQAQMRQFATSAERLNQRGDGDMAAFYLRKRT